MQAGCYLQVVAVAFGVGALVERSLLAFTIIKYAGATNPKTIVVFVAVMPGFAAPATGHLPMQLLALGTLFPAIALLLDGVWATAAGALRAWLARSPRRLAVVGGTGGLVMIGVRASLVFNGRKD